MNAKSWMKYLPIDERSLHGSDIIALNSATSKESAADCVQCCWQQEVSSLRHMVRMIVAILNKWLVGWLDCLAVRLGGNLVRKLQPLALTRLNLAILALSAGLGAVRFIYARLHTHTIYIFMQRCMCYVRTYTSLCTYIYIYVNVWVYVFEAMSRRRVKRKLWLLHKMLLELLPIDLGTDC